ncbi:MAG: [protein-PII] uridylyltransferase [Pseudomonadota bacterium]
MPTSTSPPPPISARSQKAPRPWRIGDIIDGRKLRVQLTAITQGHKGDDTLIRAQVLDQLHQALFRGRMIAQERLQQGADGLDTARLLAVVQDEVISALYDFTTTHVFRAKNPTEGERLAVFATGGYGRGVLAPSSDIDLLFLRKYKASPWAENVIEYMLYALWDMGLKVGHAFRTVDSCISLSKEDVTIKTSLLDARFLFGDADLSGEMIRQFHAECVEGHHAQFLADKLAETDARHARQGDTRYVVEPNVKNGKGGLRDLQTLYWIAKHIHGGSILENVMKKDFFTKREYQLFVRAARFFWTVRCHLHYLTGRAEERLSFDLQPEIANRLDYQDRTGQLGVERFMKRYFVAAKDVGGLSQILIAKLEAELEEHPTGLKRFIPRPGPKPYGDTVFMIDRNRLSIPEPDHFEKNPMDMLRLFAVAAKDDLEIHPEAMAAVSRASSGFRANMRKTEEARQLFFTCLLETKYPAKILKLMNTADLLGRIVPEFGGIVAQTQFNMYHHYTVDEHTLRAIETMSDIEHGRTEDHRHPARLFPQIVNRRALYVAMLLHDTGKGLGDQQIEGMRTSRKACRRLGMSPSETEIVAWLVGNHLEMSETAQKRDIADPRTVTEFAQLVGSVERLNLLHILTASDITAVGPKVWNGWKAQLLSELHNNTVAALRGGRTDESIVAAELAVRADERRQAVVDAIGELPHVMASMETAYWTEFPIETLVKHASMISRQGETLVQAEIDHDGGAVTLMISGKDRIGLFADLIQAITSQDANIVSAQIFTSENGDVLDIFTLQSADGDAFADGEDRRLRRLEEEVRKAFDGNGSKQRSKPRRGQRAAAFIVDPEVHIDAQASMNFTVIDITARNRGGLLCDVATCLSEQGLSIRSAHVSSYGERVFDAFYVQTCDGRKLTDDAEKQTLKERLLAVISSHEPDTPKTPARELAQAPAADSF